MPCDGKMTDQKLANYIYDAANALNEKLAAAEDAGLNVLIDHRSRRLNVECYRFIVPKVVAKKDYVLVGERLFNYEMDG